MIYTRQFGTQTLLAECDASLDGPVQHVFEGFAQLAATGHALAAGTSMQFGWSMLTLQQDSTDTAGTLRICEPDLLGEALIQWNGTLDLTLTVLRDQVEWLRRLDVEAGEIRFDSPLVVTPDALASRHLFALRSEPATEHDTGWSLARVPAPGERIDTRSLAPMRVYELLRNRPEVVSLLGLPVGFLVEFDGSSVRQISDSNDRTVYRLQ